MISKQALNIVAIFVLSFFQPISWANEMPASCYSYLTELVRTSNFPFNDIPIDKNNLLIDTDNGVSILAQVNYDKKQMGISYDADRTAINGWVKYDTSTSKLYNASADIDPDSPVELSFNKDYAKLFKICREEKLSISKQNCTEKSIKALSAADHDSDTQEYTVSQNGRTFFYSAPSENCLTSNDLFIIKNDKVLVSKEFDNYYYATYTRKDGSKVLGWLNKNNLTPADNSLTKKAAENFNGDLLVSQKNFAEQINKSCAIKDLYGRNEEQIDKDNKACVLSKITFPYDRFLNLGKTYPIANINQGKKVYLKYTDKFNIYIQITKSYIKAGNYNIEVTLFTEHNNKIIDSLIIYHEKSDADEFMAEQQYYAVTPSLGIFILKVSSIEEGTILDFWRSYQVNDIGKLDLVDFIKCDYSANQQGSCKTKKL